MIKDMEQTQCLELLGNNFIGRLAFISGKSPCIVPITYFYDTEEKSILSYSAKGYKIEAMRKNESVALQVDDIRSIQQWRSVMVHGRFVELESSTAKENLHRFSVGVQHTIVKSSGTTPKFIQDFSSRLQQPEIPIVYRIHITGINGKYRED